MFHADPHVSPESRPAVTTYPLPHDVHAPRLARRIVDEHSQAATGSMRDDLILLVSELVSNAVVHGRPAVTLHLVVTADYVRVDVFDHGVPLDWTSRRPQPRLTGPGGRGLAIVDLLATQWGTVATTSGKSIWFELGEAS